MRVAGAFGDCSIRGCLRDPKTERFRRRWARLGCWNTPVVGRAELLTESSLAPFFQGHVANLGTEDSDRREDHLRADYPVPEFVARS